MYTYTYTHIYVHIYTYMHTHAHIMSPVFCEGHSVAREEVKCPLIAMAIIQAREDSDLQCSISYAADEDSNSGYILQVETSSI